MVKINQSFFWHDCDQTTNIGLSFTSTAGFSGSAGHIVFPSLFQRLTHLELNAVVLDSKDMVGLVQISTLM
jgi:hypothetical protein